jgi:dihydroorotase/N-acyl-D-amino-acid deacylase
MMVPARRVILSLLLLIGLFPIPGLGAGAPEAARSEGEGLEGLDAFVEATMAEWKVPGLALAVVKDGQVVRLQGYGVRDVETKRPVTTRTLFPIASISKSFTVTGLGLLADGKKLDWDRPVREIVPEFVLKDPVASDHASTRDLVAHRTGLPRHDRVWYRAGQSRAEIVALLRHLEPSREFRAAWQYNNLMYLAAGVVAERISGQPWEDFTRERIFRPLGMTASRFLVAGVDKADDFARPHARSGDTVRAIRFYHDEGLAPAGGIVSNAEEMARYLQFHIDKGRWQGRSLLSEAMAEQMQTPQGVIPESEVQPLHATAFSELGHSSYGLGYFITSYRGRKLVWHSGSLDGFSLLFSFLPHEKIGVLVLTNLTANRPVPVCVTRNVFDRLLGLPPIDWVGRAKELDRKAEHQRAEGKSKAEAARRTGTSPTHALAEYAGTFAHPAYGSVSIRAGRPGLELAWANGSARLNHHHYDVFETDVDEDGADDNPVPRIRVAFLYNPQGNIDRLTMPLEPRVAEIVFQRSPHEPPPAPAPAPEHPVYDVVILGGRVVDGTGDAWFSGDVALSGDRIARIAPAGTLRGTAGRTIDARGLVVAPGFIDIQGHSREQLLTGDGRVIGKVTQGVTTEILGEGTTNAPSHEVREFDGPHGFDAWLRAMERHGASINFGSFLGSGTVRSYAKSMAQGPPSASELEQMKGLVRAAMKDGAFGLASALIYPPDSFVATADLIALCRELAPFGGIYITHMRSEGDMLLEAIDEAIEIGRTAGVPVEIYHLKAGGRRNWSKARAAIDKIAAARATGQDVSADMYPYTAGGTGLTACLPPWASADGKLFANLADDAVRARIRAEVEHPTSDWENLGALATPENVLVLGLRKEENRRYAGKRLAEIAADRGRDWLDTAMDLILSERQRIDTIYFMMSEENVALQLRQPWIKFGTDAGGHDPEHAEGLVHPRSYGTYPRILGKYVREEKVLPLEDAVRKMTSAVAARLSIRDRGLLREGFLADVVVFDQETIQDRATYEAPHQLSQGVRHVFVNGQEVVRDGQHTGARPGRIVRGPGYVP